MKKQKVKPNPQKQAEQEVETMTMVIHLGEVGSSIRALVDDVRKMLSPYTYMKMRVHAKNKLRDFTEASSLIGAKMLILLRCKLDKTTFAITRFPRGPTVYFDVQKYATIGDVHQAYPDSANFNKKERSESFLVCEGFTDSDQDQVIVSMFQGMFPSIKLGQCNLKLMKRVVLASKDPDGVISLRHYKVTQRDLQISDPLQRLDRGKIPDLSMYESIEDYFMESLRNAPKEKRQRAIHLQEIGPRIDMTFKQLETNVFGGMKLTDPNAPTPQKTYKYRTPKKDDHR
ncbi:Brix-domain-containing protein [Histomonas meleagridis]|uniref:Brix-domain-containing protein n=1 Tax=Histomonas meleagridis TaxID=135588 RepID=UPI00355A8B61|nr:Brix-domain-containing protein [Histomonas meleagridis]KAH0806000.1 Brix-domain-containing protein [Histomonas meleagridis]